jgi:hypothetical protein
VWDYAALKAAERMDAATSILAGVTWLAVKAANFANVNVEDTKSAELTYVVVRQGLFGHRD